MEKRCFGASDLDVSVIGLGTWPMGGARYGSSDDASAKKTIAAALESGITCFDTAPSYGNGHAEELLGRALKGKRQDVTIVTKGGLVWNEKSEVLGHNGRRTHLEAGLEGSLHRLDTDYVDLFLIHWPDKTLPAEETAAALTAIAESGKTRYVGVSNYTGEEFDRLADAMVDVPLVANQVSYHMFDQRWARSCFQTCQERGAGVMAYGSLAHGLLTGTLTRATRFDTSDWRASGVIFGQALLTDENRERNLDVVDRLAGIAASAGMTLPQMALAWVLANPAVTVSLVGARTPDEIIEAARVPLAALTDTHLRQIEDALAGAAGVVPALAVEQ